jgi:UDP-N-acetyl-2-amino-2-deoxyglucuronate dehydrogenase
MITEPMKLAIVGCGQIVTHHIAALAALDGGFEVVALCDPSAERRRIIGDLLPEGLISVAPPAEFATLGDLLEDQTMACSVVFVAVPHDLHEAITRQALASGKHVVLEKPLAPTLDSCRNLHAAAKVSAGMLVVAEQSPYWEEVVLAKSLLKENAIGQLVSASSYYYESMRDNVTSGTDADGGLGWRCSLERCGGGIVIDGGLHWLRPLRELCGDVDSVVGVSRRNLERGLLLEGETLAHALLKMKHSDGAESYLEQPDGSGPLICTFSANMMHTSVMAHNSCPYFRLTGTMGELVVAGTGLTPNGGGGLRIYNEECPNGRDLFPIDRQGGFFLGFRGLWCSILDILRRGDREAALRTVRDAAADVAVALALYKSSDSGQWEGCELLH